MRDGGQSLEVQRLVQVPVDVGLHAVHARLVLAPAGVGRGAHAQAFTSSRSTSACTALSALPGAVESD